MTDDNAAHCLGVLGVVLGTALILLLYFLMRFA